MSEKLKSNYRWVICALLFFATTTNYIDRQVIGVLKPMIEKDMGWTQIDYGNMVFAFQLAYALGFLLAGAFIDRVGVKKGFFWAVLVWSVASMLHGLISHVPLAARFTLSAGHSMLMTVALFCVARFLLGLAEAGNFPACIKSVSEWFPKRERALATGLLNSGTNIASLITPLVAPWMALAYGWDSVFYATGLLGFIWMGFWWFMYRAPQEHPRVSPAELALIQSDPADPPAVKIPWLTLFSYRQTYTFFVGKFLTDPIWYLYAFWLPDIFNKSFGVNVKQLGPPMVAVYMLASVGSIGGGWLSAHFLRRGWSVNRSRKMTLLICALCVVPVFICARTHNLWLAVGLFGLAAAAHQGFSANLYTLVSDTCPKRVISSVTGVGGMGGAVGGMIIAQFTGHILQKTNNDYTIPLAVASVVYLLAVLSIHLINPKLKPMQVLEA